MGVDAEMYVSTKETVTKEHVLGWAKKLAELFDPKSFHIEHPMRGYGSTHCLTIVNEMERGEDGYTSPVEGETFMQVHWLIRYYGEGYERGPLPLIINVAQFLEEVIPGAVVWYGGDSGGGVSEFGARERQKVWKHFCDVGHSPYRQSFNSLSLDKDAPPCCELCSEQTIRYCWGGFDKVRGYFCQYCGWHVKTEDGGDTWTQWMNDYYNQAVPYARNR